MTARARALAAVVLALGTGCSAFGLYDDPPTECPKDPVCCSTGDPLANGGCDWTCNDASAPDFRLSAMELAGAAAASEPFRAGIEDAVRDGGLVWLVDMASPGAGTVFWTGAGSCVEPAVCRFDRDHPPATGAAELAPDGTLALPAHEKTFDTEVVVQAPALGERFVLPLRECTLTGHVSAGGNCIGRREGDGWTEEADLACEIAANDARLVGLTADNVSLCDLLAGCGGLFCCDAPPAAWPNAPDENVAGDPAWSLEARVAAIGVRIAVD